MSAGEGGVEGERGPAPRGAALEALRAAGDALSRMPRALALAPLAAWMALVWWLSSRPAGDAEPHLLGSWITNLAHAPVFGVLALLAALCLPRAGRWPRLDRRARLAVLAFVLLYAAVDELHQASSPGRSPSPYDVVTDLVGAGCTLWIAAYVRARGSSERGLRRRLLAGVLLCLLSALAATYEPLGNPLGPPPDLVDG